MESTTKKRKLKVSGLLTILAFIIFVIGLFCIIVGVPKKRTIETPYYSYKIARNTKYTVDIKPELVYFYEQLNQPSSKIYPSNYIDKFNINMTYIYEGSEITNFDYDYNIKAQIIGKVKDDNKSETIWEKEYILKEPVIKQLSNTKALVVNENITIDYNTYNSIVTAYRETTKLNIEANLNITLSINYKTTLNNEKNDQIKKNDNVSISIPLTETTTKLVNNYQPTEENKLVNIEKIEPDYFILIIGIGFILTSIIVYIIACNKKVVTSHGLYKKNIEKVIKEYGDLIVTVKNKPNVKHLRVMALATIDDLVDVAEQNNVNIIHYEIPKKSESFLLVITAGYVYVYIVTDEEIEYSK